MYAQRATLSKAVEAAAIWQAALDRNPSDFDAAWKRARAGYWIGGHETTQAARDAAYEAAMAAARKAIAAHPDKPDGHFWLAANMGGYAQDHGIRGGLKFRGDIRDELEKVLTLDKAFQQGSARSRAGPLVLPGPGTLRRQQAQVRRASAGRSRLQSPQHRHPVVPGRDARGTGSAERRHRGVAADREL